MADERPWLRSYPPGVPVGLNVPPLSLSQVLDQAAADFGKTPAIAFLGRSITYRRLHDQVAQLAGSFAELGVDRGDRIALVLPNCPQFVVAFFAAVRIGAVVVPLNPTLDVASLRDRLTDSGARLVVVIDQAYESVAAVKAATVVQDIVVTSLREYASRAARRRARSPFTRYRSLRELLASASEPLDDSVLYFDELIEGSPGRAESVPLDAGRQPAVLLYTAGTMDSPRAAILTHLNLIAATCQYAVWDRFMARGGEATLVATPMHTPWGLTLGLLGTVFAAGVLLLIPTNEADLVIHCTRDWSPSMLPATPEVYRMLAAWPNRAAVRRCLRGMRTSMSHGLHLRDEDAAYLRRQTGIPATEAYGLAETGGVALANPLNANARPGTVGIPLPGTDARIVDERDPTRVLPIGTAGELAIRGPQVSRGYWNRTQETAAAFRGGWLLTGDIAVMGPDGYFTIIDRKADTIVTNGFVVFPSEVEQAVLRHPGIVDCAAIGVPDGHAGQAIAVCVVPQPDMVVPPESVREVCARLLPSYMIPREVRIVRELPRTSSGALQRRLLRDAGMRTSRPRREIGPLPVRSATTAVDRRPRGADRR